MKKWKRAIPILAGLLLATGTLSACGNGKQELHVYNWGDYIDMDTVTTFEKEYNVKVIYQTFDSNEAMYVKVKDSKGAYDVLVPSDYMIERMIKEDMLAHIDFGNVPNVEHVDPRFRSTSHDPTGAYSIPYTWGAVGIMYNQAMVTEPVDSWSILWDEAYSGKIFMYDSMRDSIGATLKFLGYSINTRSQAELDEATQALIVQKPLVQAYLTDPIKDKMIGNEGALAIVYSGDASYCQEFNEDIEFAIPKEGSNIWWDGVVIPKGAPHKELAEKFINFLLEPEIAAQNAEFTGFATANLAAIPLIDPELTSNHVFLPTDEEIENCEFFQDLGDFQKNFDEAWTKIKMVK